MNKENRSALDRELFSELIESPIHPLLINMVRPYVHSCDPKFRLQKYTMSVRVSTIQPELFLYFANIAVKAADGFQSFSDKMSGHRSINGLYLSLLLVVERINKWATNNTIDARKNQALFNYANQTA